ncbi:RNA polymerase sigma-70 factor (ECF subfamily) [Breznakia blatticola]|uniref:RNA polymerase sigma-70 factor (ECF subfamily) n=1 Tax=Breznakia blatticola TaxID=1754012 RepID=A0A4R8A6U9_9FIRM|nr:RNA polymerase sigma factor [Breznakia blatticola]TDW26420.1 RNA polymerase sigma-70 factor (ECF subfamily) [Breznakia blatticola]
MENRWLEILYHTYHQRLYLFALSLAKDEASAEDLVSETFIKLGVSNLKSEKEIEAWLFRVLKNQFIDTYRKNHRILDEGQYQVEWLVDPYDATKKYIKDEQKRWLYRKIYTLSDKERNVMLLSLVSQLDDVEIAQLLKISLDHIRSIRYRVKQKLIAYAKEEEML